MHVKLDEASFKMPCKHSTIMPTRKDQVLNHIIYSRHNIIAMCGLRRIISWVFCGQITVYSHILLIIVFIVFPDSESSVPACSDKERLLIRFILIVHG
jgi:hypothetical protein